MPGTKNTPSMVTTLLERLEQDPTLGRAAEALATPMAAALGGPASDVLRGRPLGHALHPILVQLPVGALVSASVLDMLQGPRAAGQSRLLMGLAALSVVPAAATGWAEWVRADDRTKRVGVAHAALNLFAGATSLASYLLRRRTWSMAPVALTGVAGVAFGAAGLLGGHLSLVRKYASHDRASDLEGPLHGEFT